MKEKTLGMSNITLLFMDLIAAEACNTTNNVRKSPRSANGRARVFQFYHITTVLFLRSILIFLIKTSKLSSEGSLGYILERYFDRKLKNSGM